MGIREVGNSFSMCLKTYIELVILIISSRNVQDFKLQASHVTRVGHCIGVAPEDE